MRYSRQIQKDKPKYNPGMIEHKKEAITGQEKEKGKGIKNKKAETAYPQFRPFPNT